jgi:hypothetical protein
MFCSSTERETRLFTPMKDKSKLYYSIAYAGASLQAKVCIKWWLACAHTGPLFVLFGFSPAGWQVKRGSFLLLRKGERG